MRDRWRFLAAFLLIAYGTGAAFVESFINNASWSLIGTPELTACHRFLVAPMAVGSLLTLLLL